MEKLEPYKKMIKNIEPFLNEKKSLMISKFIRSNIRYIREIQEEGFLLKEISDNLSNNLNIDINYNSFWVSINRHLKKISGNKKATNEVFKNEENENLVGTKKEKTKGSEKKVITDTEGEPKEIEFDDDYSWLKDPELGFDHLDHPVIIDTLKNYQLTIDDLREIKVDKIKYNVKCLDLITALGEKRKEERISEIYFGKK